jgi:sugar lactone lactonase YvrE
MSFKLFPTSAPVHFDLTFGAGRLYSYGSTYYEEVDAWETTINSFCPKSGRELSNSKHPGYASALAVDCKGTFFVAQYGSPTISRDGSRWVSNPKANYYYSALALDKSSSLVYAALSHNTHGTSKIVVYRRSGSVEHEYDFDKIFPRSYQVVKAMAIDESTKTLYIACKENGVYALDSNGSSRRISPWPSSYLDSSAIAVDSHGRVYVVCGYHKTTRVYVFDSRGDLIGKHDVDVKISGYQVPSLVAIAIDPTSSRVFVRDLQRRLYVMCPGIPQAVSTVAQSRTVVSDCTVQNHS